MTDAQAHNHRILKRATYASVAVALMLIAVKFGAYLLTGSVSLLSTLLDSLLDAAASVVNLIAVRQALVPPDREHRFGHGKAEPLAALGQSAFIGIGGDPMLGTTTRDALQSLDADTGTDAVVIVGEIGGDMEEEAARYARSVRKPIVAFIAGAAARRCPLPEQVGEQHRPLRMSAGEIEEGTECLADLAVGGAEPSVEVGGDVSGVEGEEVERPRLAVQGPPLVGEEAPHHPELRAGEDVAGGVAVVLEGPLGVELCRPGGKSSLCICRTEEKPAHLHLAFTAENRRQVDAFHRAALAAGGKDHGAPGLRPQYHAHYYAAFVIGPDGHNIEVVCHEPAA